VKSYQEINKQNIFIGYLHKCKNDKMWRNHSIFLIFKVRVGNMELRDAGLTRSENPLCGQQGILS
jgi:hypothetical protein